MIVCAIVPFAAQIQRHAGASLRTSIFFPQNQDRHDCSVIFPFPIFRNAQVV